MTSLFNDYGWLPLYSYITIQDFCWKIPLAEQSYVPQYFLRHQSPTSIQARNFMQLLYFKKWPRCFDPGFPILFLRCQIFKHLGPLQVDLSSSFMNVGIFLIPTWRKCSTKPASFSLGPPLPEIIPLTGYPLLSSHDGGSSKSMGSLWVFRTW